MAKVIVVGGGLAGLTAAFRLCGDTQVQVFEAAASLGGQIRTDRSAGFAIERGAEGFVFCSEAVPTLATDLGMPADELIGQAVMQSYGFGDGGLRVLAPGEAAAFLDFQVPKTDLGQGLRTFRHGMASLVWALEDRLRNRVKIRCDATVKAVELSTRGACVTLDDGSRHEAELVVVASSAHGAATLLAHVGDAVLGLSRAPTLSSVTVELAFVRTQVDHALDGTGFVVGAAHQQDGLRACTFTSAKFADRSPPGHVSLRLFFRPSPEQLQELDDDAWTERALSGLQRIIPVKGQPLRVWVSRWPDALPVFNDEHRAAVAHAEAALSLHRIVLAGSAFHGSGIDAAVRSGEAAASAVKGLIV